VALLKVGSFPPPGTGNEIVLSIVVQVAEVGAFAPELIVELSFGKGVKVGRRGVGNEQTKTERGNGKLHGY
jgi:hypothetical protein